MDNKLAKFFRFSSDRDEEREPDWPKVELEERGYYFDPERDGYVLFDGTFVPKMPPSRPHWG